MGTQMENAWHAAQQAFQIEADALAGMAGAISEESFRRAVTALARAPRIAASGCGHSGIACRHFAHLMCCIERPALFLTPSDAVHGALGVLQKGDVFILISKGGNTKELTCLIPACKSKGATLVGVSENPDSIIAREADIYLKVRVAKEPCRFNMLATASTLAVISTFDAICIALMQMTGYTREQFAVIHPAGAVGERLLAKKP